jgi:hypothetical protein
MKKYRYNDNFWPALLTCGEIYDGVRDGEEIVVICDDGFPDKFPAECFEEVTQGDDK